MKEEFVTGLAATAVLGVGAIAIDGTSEKNLENITSA